MVMETVRLELVILDCILIVLMICPALFGWFPFMRHRYRGAERLRMLALLLGPVGQLINQAPGYLPLTDAEQLACMIASIILVGGSLPLVFQARRIARWLHMEMD